MPEHLTRREMYDLVWSGPLADVASKLGIGEWTLRNLCQQHRVPLPVPSYWRDKEAGKRVKQTIFAATSDPSFELISLDSTKPIDPTVQEALLRKRAAVAKPLTPKAPKPLTEPTDWQPISQAHPILQKTARALRAAKPDGYDVIDLAGEGILTVTCSKDSVERAIFLLETLVRQVEVRGMGCAVSGKEVTVKRGAESLTFTLNETIARKPHEPTIEDLKAESRRLRSGGSDYSYYWNKAYPEFDRVPTGQLVVSITSWGHWGPRRNWKDSTRTSLNSQIEIVAQAFDESLDDQRKRRLEQERQSRIGRRAEENRGRAEQRRKREEAREAVVAEIVDLRMRADRLRNWIDWAKPIDDPDASRMVAWGHDRLAKIERALDPSSLGARLRERELFPELDPYAPLPTDPDTETDLPLERK
ncbi:MAG: hypothetical protein J0H01_14195 [Rhizobiales bacterium]|nr:hypothetical protein [Hyphomicrobiales bacterium]